MRFVRTLPAMLVAVGSLLGAPVFAQDGAGGDVCFYQHINFQGRQWCIDARERVPAVPQIFNDQISSVQIPRGVRVTVCEHVNFAGRCLTLDRSVASLVEAGFNDVISSIASDVAQAGPGPGREGFGGPGRPGDFRGPPPVPAPRGPQSGGPPPRDPGASWDDVREQMAEFRAACEDGERRACVRLGIIIGENRERRAQWRREHPDFFWWER
jgi:hypothetical protein